MRGRIGNWQKPKVDVFSLDGLIAWLETMPADGIYCYLDNGECLLHRYFTAVGLDIKSVGGFSYSLKSGTVGRLPETFGDISVDGEWTFGAALARARAIQDPK